MEAWVKAKRHLEGNILWKNSAQAWDNGKNKVVLTTTREAKGRKIKKRWSKSLGSCFLLLFSIFPEKLADSSQRALIGCKLRSEPLIFTQSFSPSQYTDYSSYSKPESNLFKPSVKLFPCMLCICQLPSFSISQNKWYFTIKAYQPNQMACRIINYLLTWRLTMHRMKFSSSVSEQTCITQGSFFNKNSTKLNKTFK